MSIPISVVMPIYNGNNYMEESIQNILSQSFEDFEFIISNDGSLDNTSEIINRYAKVDKRIVVIDRKYNMGIAGTLNQSMAIARGEYIVLTTHDDLMPNDALEEVYKFFKENPDISLCGPQFLKIFGNEDRIKEMPRYHNEIKYIRTPFLGMGIGVNYFKREVIKQFSFRETHGPAMDMDILAEILMKSNIRVAGIPKTLSYVRRHDTNYSRDTASAIREQMLIQLRFLAHIYKAPVDPIIAYAIKNIYNINRDILVKTQSAITKISNHLDRDYSEKMGIDLGGLWNNRMSFLLKAS